MLCLWLNGGLGSLTDRALFHVHTQHIWWQLSCYRAM